VASTTDWAKAQTVGKPKSGNVALLDTQSERASTAGVSESIQRTAEKVAKASPEKIQHVARGEKTLPQAV
jgi:SOS-response transcriptional repressor LexA